MITTLNVHELPITVVIPAFNEAHFIKETLNSVWSQTAIPSEVIVVDDGSTDQTGAIAEASGAKVLRQKNRGLSAARNTGIHAASQQWIAFLDADDIWEPDKLESQWKVVKACQEVQMIFTDFMEFNTDGIIKASFLDGLEHYQQVKRDEISSHIMYCEEESLRKQFHKGNFIRPSTVLIRRDLLIELGLFDETISHCEDLELWLRRRALTNTAVVERPLMRYRDHKTSLSSNNYKMAFSMAHIADRVLAKTELYADDAIDHYFSERPTLYLNLGRFAEESGKILRAREYYLRSWHLGGGSVSLVLAVLSIVPAQMRSFMKEMVHLFRKLLSTHGYKKIVDSASSGQGRDQSYK